MDYQKPAFSARAINTLKMQENRNGRVYDSVWRYFYAYGAAFSGNPKYKLVSPVGRLISLNKISLLNPHQGSYKVGPTGFIYERIEPNDLYGQAKKLKSVNLLARVPIKCITDLKSRSYQPSISLSELEGMEGFGNGIIEEYRTAYHPIPTPLNSYTYYYTKSKSIPLSYYYTNKANNLR